MLFFILGLVCGSVLTLYVRQCVYKRFAPRVYNVCSFSRVADETGVYEMNFYLSPNTVLEGYTKKLPPEGVKPEDLTVKVRSLHSMRGKYRVFWQLK